MGDLHPLAAREYKLLLEPAAFADDPLRAAATFWKRHLAPLSAKTAGAEASGAPTEHRERRVQYWDTARRALGDADYTLRQRQTIEAGAQKPLRLALKLRSPDFFVAAQAAARVGKGRLTGADIAFEEDIAPLAVTLDRARAEFAERPSIRSRFALTIEGKIADGDVPETLDEARQLFPTLAADIRAGGKRLQPGPDIREITLKGAAFAFGAGTGDVTITLWYFGKAKQPKVAEVSFKCPLKGGQMPRRDALAALHLFNNMQSKLGDWINRHQTSKTELALPERKR